MSDSRGAVVAQMVAADETESLTIGRSPLTVVESDLFPALDSAKESALRASIRRFGVINPVLYDQHGELVDGAHRTRIAGEEGVDCPSAPVVLPDDPSEREAALVSLNNDRRQAMSPQKRREVVQALREEGHSYRAIGNALGVSQTQARTDAQETGVKDFTPALQVEPDRVTGQDGKSYPAAARPKRDPDARRTSTGYRKSTDPYAVETQRHRVLADSQRRRLVDGLSEINGICRGLREIDFGMAAAVLDNDEINVWVGKTEQLSRDLRIVGKLLMEVRKRGA